MIIEIDKIAMRNICGGSSYICTCATYSPYNITIPMHIFKETADCDDVDCCIASCCITNCSQGSVPSQNFDELVTVYSYEHPNSHVLYGCPIQSCVPIPATIAFKPFRVKRRILSRAML